ncbi:MAG: redoxin domain-containing protein [Anaerolineae bacterium]|nr:redoxin domain-containing protein [Anaerolineae bacterium]
MTDLPDPNRPQTPPPSASGIPPSWSGASAPAEGYPPYPSTDLPSAETPPAPRRGPLGLSWPWWIAGGCAVLLLCCLCTLLMAALFAIANGRSTLPASPVPGPAPRVTPAPTAPRPSFSDDAPSEPAPAAAPQQGNSASPTGTAALDFELSTLDGQKVRLSDFRGRPVVINFWATWCGPCLAEMPLLKKTYDELKDTGLVLLAVDVQEKPDTVRKFAEKEQLPFTVLLDETGLVATYYRVNAYPTTFFVDPNGVIQSWQRGTLTKTTLDRHLDRIR